MQSDFIKKLIKYLFVFMMVAVFTACQNKPKELKADLWLTHSDGSVLFQKQDGALIFKDSAQTKNPTIELDTTKTYQTMDGFGYTLTGGSAILLNKLEESARKALLQELFDTDSNNIGVSYLRLSIGASDLSDTVFSYNDLPPNETDPKLTKFTLE